MHMLATVSFLIYVHASSNCLHEVFIDSPRGAASMTGWLRYTCDLCTCASSSYNAYGVLHMHGPCFTRALI